MFKVKQVFGNYEFLREIQAIELGCWRDLDEVIITVRKYKLKITCSKITYRKI